MRHTSGNTNIHKFAKFAWLYFPLYACLYFAILLILVKCTCTIMYNYVQLSTVMYNCVQLCAIMYNYGQLKPC